jgi:hypothetical protein
VFILYPQGLVFTPVWVFSNSELLFYIWDIFEKGGTRVGESDRF